MEALKQSESSKSLSQGYIQPLPICPTCCGSKKMLGGGMVKVECLRCNGTGKLEVVQMADSINKAASEIVTDNPELSESQARSMIAESLTLIKTTPSDSVASEAQILPERRKPGRKKGWNLQRN